MDKVGPKTSKRLTQMIADCVKDGGNYLELRELTIREFPENIRELTKLTNLVIDNCRFHALPEWLTELRSLETLQLMESGLERLPDWLGRLPLSILNLSRRDAMLSLGPVLGLKKLDILLLQHANLTEIKEDLGSLESLRQLRLLTCGLNRLPETVGNLSDLVNLDLDSNRLSSLPESIARLSKLQRVSLRNNALSSIPAVLHELPELTELDLRENRNLPIPAEILLRKNAREILSYARHLSASQRRRPLNEAKLILVGRGAVGKTTLVHQLVHGEFVQKHKTKGIKVSDWNVAGEMGTVTAHVWDFGGQEIMHGTHQFFLTERSLYLLVLAGREDREDEDAEYWLKMIRAFGGDSPVIVVLNKIKEHRFDLNEESLREKYPNIRAFVETDCRTNTGVRKLRRVVTKEINQMESIRAGFPAAWFEIKQRLTDMPENFMPFDRFREICKEHGEQDTTDQEELAGFLHLLGIALNYRDDPRLCETSVLNPKWVTTGIYKLLNDDTIRRRRGLLTLSDLARVLPKEDYPQEMHDFLLRLMKKFELCFPLDDEGREYLIPELLGKKQPKLGDFFDSPNCLRFEYHYGSLLPEGLLPRFIVRAYTRIESNLRWRTGVVLKWKTARALVKSDEADRQVLIRVRGPLEPRRELLALIREHFDSIHRNFQKLDPVEKVQVPNEPGLFVDYAKIEVLAARHRGIFTEYHAGTLYNLDARQLIATFELPGARRNPHLRGAAITGELALDLAMVEKQKVR